MIRLYKIFGALALASVLMLTPTASFAGIFVGVGIGVSVGFAPPPIPVYEQPPCYQPDTIWTPGYWAYGEYGYYWVPGTWVAAPQPGYLWTPGYWGYGGGGYAWHGGYWGPHVGFYGGVNYGFGYGGNGYDGGGWEGNHFRYNTAITNVNRTTINNVYENRTVVNNYDNSTINRTSYNGGEGGIAARPTQTELAYRSEPHLAATAVQRQHIETAGQNRNYLATVNHGRPAEAAIAQPLDRDNRPANFAPATALDKRAVTTTEGGAASPFSRFDRPETTNAAGAARDRSTGEAPKSYEETPSTYRAPNAYRAPDTYRAPNAYHAPSTYRAPAYHAPSSYRAPNAYRPASSYRAPSYHAPSAPHAAAHPAPHEDSGHKH